MTLILSVMSASCTRGITGSYLIGGGVFPITIQAIKNGNVVGEASSEIIVADECRVSDTLTCLVIGDSTVCSAYLIPSLSDDFESDGIPVKFLGTQGEEPYCRR